LPIVKSVLSEIHERVPEKRFWHQKTRGELIRLNLLLVYSSCRAWTSPTDEVAPVDVDMLPLDELVPKDVVRDLMRDCETLAMDVVGLVHAHECCVSIRDEQPCDTRAKIFSYDMKS
jgi:hypothetical protein